MCVLDEGHSRNASYAIKGYPRFYYYHCVNTSADGQLTITG
jgi:hypothetical protein